MSWNYTKVFTVLSYNEHFIILTSTITGCVLISDFSSLLGIPIRVTSFAAESKICSIAAGTKMYNSIVKKMKKKHDTIVFLGKSKLSRIEDLISTALSYSNITQDEFLLINNVLKEYDNMKKIKNLKT